MNTAQINHWFQFKHRELRARFSMETLERHSARLLAAMYSRCYR